jgi:branched-chain amino acid transport system permease protein
LAGAALVFESLRHGWRGKLQDKREATRARFMATSAVQRVLEYEHSRRIAQAMGVALLLLAPFVLGRYWNYTLGTVGIYIILGLGLNIVVGMAGLLNLGYAAFFAIGSYTVAILTSPQYGIEWSFWVALPIGILLAGITGVLLSLPVLRMRGDYLAIVTLGFGEIIRILLKSDVLTDLTGGPRGIRAVGGPTIFGIPVNNEFYFVYLILLGIVLAIVVTLRLQSSRLGRAWMAMREDEDVAQATGIYTLQYKVLAFALSAAFAGLAGVVFASRNKFTGPEDFTLLVSVNVLSLVIIGGIDSIPGIVLGAFVLKGLPEVLRQLEDYRMLAFGALLVVMMIVRPEGLWPAPRRRMELGREEPPPEDGVLKQDVMGA